MFSLHLAVFHQNLILDTFWMSFGSLLAPICLPLGALGLPMGPQSGLWDPLWETLFSMPFFSGFWVPPGSPNEGAAVWRLTSGDLVKAYILSKSSEILMGKRYFAKVCFPRPSGKGDY